MQHPEDPGQPFHDSDYTGQLQKSLTRLWLLGELLFDILRQRAFRYLGHHINVILGVDEAVHQFGRFLHLVASLEGVQLLE